MITNTLKDLVCLFYENDLLLGPENKNQCIKEENKISLFNKFKMIYKYLIKVKIIYLFSSFFNAIFFK